jgi:hypothetical protein
VEKDATAIAKLGHGIEGWGDYSAGNNGDWHFSSYMDALGGSMGNNSSTPATASFDNADGEAAVYPVSAWYEHDVPCLQR